MAIRWFLDVLGCPACTAALDLGPEPGPADALVCPECDEDFAWSDGVPDFVKGNEAHRVTSSQRVMMFRPLTRVYERLWRPVFTRLLAGIGHDDEQVWSLERLSPSADATILDLACGPGNTTRAIAELVVRGRVLGVDYSMPMLQQARRAKWDGSGRVAYVRADAHDLPLQPDSLDGANCAGAFYMFADPEAVLGRLADALRPGAVLTLMTSRRPPGVPTATDMLVRPAGVRLFGQGEMTEMLDAAGFDELAAYEAGFMMLVAARCR